MRTAKENERDYEEVCVLYVLCVTVLFRLLGRFMVVRKVVMTMDIRSVCMCVKCIVLFLGRIPTRNQIFV